MFLGIGVSHFVRIDPVENSIGSALENTHGQESNTGRVKFQYYPFKFSKTFPSIFGKSHWFARKSYSGHQKIMLSCTVLFTPHIVALDEIAMYV